MIEVVRPVKLYFRLTLPWTLNKLRFIDTPAASPAYYSALKKAILKYTQKSIFYEKIREFIWLDTKKAMEIVD